MPTPPTKSRVDLDVASRFIAAQLRAKYVDPDICAADDSQQAPAAALSPAARGVIIELDRRRGSVALALVGRAQRQLSRARRIGLAGDG